jgi:ATP-dependent DNA helicase RecG
LKNDSITEHAKKGKVMKKPFGSKEGLALEFKRAAERLPANFFDTVCAFLNMDGGLIILGVEDDGIISGINENSIERIKADIANLSNNPQKLDPPHLLFPHEEQVGGKWVIKVLVPASSQVHQTDGSVFLRSEDGDYRIKGVNRLAGLMNRKLSFFTEQRVYPYLGIKDLDPALFEKAKKLMLGRQPQHPWANLPPEELLKVAGFVRPDYSTGKPGYTLAAALMFGYDTTIQSIVPGYKFDALLRRRDTERYDDRLIIRGNLIDAFDQLMGFVDKHLNDPFYMEGTTSISLRSIIFRELVANIIAHREYTSASPATMMIYTDRVEFKNPNVPHYHGRIDPGNFTPFPKNPTICKFMIQIGRYEELGSGVRKVNHYLPHYAPGAGKPVFEDGDMFKVTVPLVATTTRQVIERPKHGPESGPESGLELGLESMAIRVLMSLRETSRSKSEISDALGHTSISSKLNLRVNELLNAGLIERTLPDKPTSRLQKYRLTDKGWAALPQAKQN